MSESVNLPEGMRVADGVTVYTGAQKGVRQDAFEWIDEETCRFKVTLAKHPQLKPDEKALLHGTFDFRNVKVRELMALAAKFLVFRWVQRDARLCVRIKEAEGRTWRVREFLDLERRSPVRRTVEQIQAELLADPGKMLGQMSAEQRAALLALLSGSPAETASPTETETEE